MIFDASDKLITHYGCMDGAGCAVLFLANGGKAHNIHYSSPSHEVVDKVALELFHMHKGRIFLADISVSEECAKVLDERKDIKLIDHHKTAIPLAKYSWCEIEVENKRCGSRMFFDFITADTYNYSHDVRDHYELITFIDDRDRWINKYSESTELAELFIILKQRNFVERFLHKPYCGGLEADDLWMIEVAKQNKKDYLEHIESKRITKHLTDGSGNEQKLCFVYCDPPYATDAGHYLYDKYDYDAVVMVSPQSVSFRAPPHSKIDLSLLVKQYGGGGHQSAAGCNTPAITGKNLIDQVIDNLRLP